jgi:hypothetical protein
MTPKAQRNGHRQWITDFKYYYHTMFNSRIRMVEMHKIDFDSGKPVRYIPLDLEQKEDIQEVVVH